MKSFKISQLITDRQDASLGLYFKDVSKQSMINADKEVSLAKRIKQGDKEALQELVNANLRFAISVAKQYQNKGLPLVDLIQEANIGLIKAAQSYDETRGFRFISYAVWWIRQSIMHAISDQCRTIRVPMNQIANVNKINKVTAKFEQEHIRKPSPEELEDLLDIPVYDINLATASFNRSVSLDTPFSMDEDAGSLVDIIPNENAESTDSSLIKDGISKELEVVLSKLSYRERDVLRMSYGLGMQAMQHEEIASRFGIGCERVRQIQHEAIKKIRDRYSDLLKELL